MHIKSLTLMMMIDISYAEKDAFLERNENMSVNQ